MHDTSCNNEIMDKSKPSKGGAKAPLATQKSSAEKDAALARDTYLVTPTPNWHSIDLPEPDATRRIRNDMRRDVNGMLLRGMDLLKQEGIRFANDRTRAAGDASFMRTILSGGTMTDRISALTLLVQASPLHNLLALEQLFAMAKKKNRRLATLAIDALKDLLTGGGLISSSTGGLLPADRKLKYFIDSLADVPVPTDAHLVVFAFEDRLKRLYFELLGVLEQQTHDTLVHVRSKTTATLLDLLVARPEQEQNLLKLLVNKLGDLERKIAAKASYLLHQLTTEHHPAMKLVVVKALEEFMMRPHMTPRAHYFAVITLNQLMLSDDDKATALYLIDVYFSFFNMLVKDHQAAKAPAADPIDHKILSALLTGVNRAFPFVKTLEDEAGTGADGSDNAATSALAKHLDTLFKISHYNHFSVRVQALSLIFQVMQTTPTIVPRFYRALYSTLADPRGIVHTKQLALFLNLLYRAVKADTNIDRVQAFLKRILQMAANERHVGVVIGCLWIASHIMQAHPVAWNMVKLAEESAKYDAFHRTPEYAHAASSCLWELVPLLYHFHPSVQVFAQALLQSQPITLPAGVDPLETYTLAKFLDKFVYKKPKKNPKVGPSNSLARTINKTRTGFIPDEDAVAAKGEATVAVGAGMPLNSDAFLHMKPEDVAADEAFFHRFFTKQEQTKPRSRKPEKSLDDNFDNVRDEGDLGGASDMDDEDGDMSDDEIDRAIMSSRGFSKDHLPDDMDDVDDFDDDADAAFAEAMAADDYEDEEGGEGGEFVFDDDQEDDEDGVDSDDDSSRRRKKKGKDNDKTKLGYSLGASPFASAEEFTRMIESNEGLDSDDNDDFGIVEAKSLGDKKKRKKTAGKGGKGPGKGRPAKRRRH
ncbi:hypothetical protein AMAG_11365, partial [Allomyces macrogynus ATCC 38327]